jgi:hypothetical protein
VVSAEQQVEVVSSKHLVRQSSMEEVRLMSLMCSFKQPVTFFQLVDDVVGGKKKKKTPRRRRRAQVVLDRAIGNKCLRDICNNADQSMG